MVEHLNGIGQVWHSIFFVSYFIENNKTNQYTNFHMIWFCFSFYVDFCEQHHPYNVKQAILLCIYWSWLWEIENARNIHISL